MCFVQMQIDDIGVITDDQITIWLCKSINVLIRRRDIRFYTWKGPVMLNMHNKIEKLKGRSMF